MKKFSIETKTIMLNKEKINIISLENKNDKFIIYSELNIQENKINKDLFTKMEFPENIQITPKKKFNDLKFTIELNKGNKMYKLLKNNNEVYYLNNNKNIIINNDTLKLILNNGNLYSTIKEESKNNLVDNILSNSKKNIVDDILKKNIDIIKQEVVSEEDVSEEDVSEEAFSKEAVSKEAVSEEDVLEEAVSEKFISKEVVTEKVVTEEAFSEEAVSKEAVSKEVVTEEVVTEEVVSEEVVTEEAVSKEVVTEEVVSEEVVSEKVISEKVIVQEKVFIKERPYIPPIGPLEIMNTQENIKDVIKSNIVKDNISNIENNIKNITFKNNIDNSNDIKIIKENNSEEFENKKDKLDSEIFNLENILSDFNKLFHSIGAKQDTETKNVIENTANIENKSVNTSHSTFKNTENKPLIQPVTINNNKTNIINNIKPKIVNNEPKIVNNVPKIMNNEYKIMNKPENIQNIYTVKINYQNIMYRLNTIKLIETADLNFSNLFKSKIHDNNIVNKFNLSYELEQHNSSYIFSFFNQKYLINKISNSIVLTNLLNRSSQIIKNKENFKIGNYDFTLLNESTIIVPMLNKKIFDNNYGTSYNLYVPRI